MSAHRGLAKIEAELCAYLWLEKIRWKDKNQSMSIRVFISHSGADKELAEALIRLLRAALPLDPDSIRCTSVHGYKLPTGAEVDAQVRSEAVDATTFIAILTPASLESMYVLFELGARWGVGKPLFPLMARGTTTGALEGPLHAIHARECVAPELYQFLADMAKALSVQQYSPQAFQSELVAFITMAATSTAPATAKAQTAVLGTQGRGALALSARQICTEVREAPPMQEERAGGKYVGCTVDWETTLQSASQEPGTQDGIRLSLNPWEPEGYDTSIKCRTTLGKNPELPALPKKAKIRARGTITRVGPFDVDLGVSQLTIMSESEIRGTRPRFLVQDIRRQLGAQVSASVTDNHIEDCIKAQIRIGHPLGLELLEGRKIVPEIEDGSTMFNLVILYTAKLLIETSNSFSDEQRRDHVWTISNEIHELENPSQFTAV